MKTDIKELVEKIVFNEEQLFELKEALSQFGVNKLSIKSIKSMILDQRTRIMEDAIDLLNFYMDQRPKQLKTIPSEELSELQTRLKEREALLEKIGMRLERIVTKNTNASESEVIEFIQKELDAAQIHLWLEVGTLLELETGRITNDYKFLMWLLVCVEKYYAYLFGEENDISLPDKVKALKLPKKLEDDFLVMAHNRNMNAHDIAKIPDAFFPIMKNCYFKLFKHFVHESLVPKVSNQFQCQDNSEFLLNEVKKAISSQNLKLELDFNSLLKIMLGN